jgi:hypothetical protein
MPRGGRRTGAGRKPGSTSRPKEEVERERAFAAMRKQAAEEAKRKREAEAAARHAEREKRRAEREQTRAEKVQVQILPPLPEGTGPPPGLGPLRFLESLMDDDRLPLGFRRDCAALALPFRAPKPIIGLKDIRNDPGGWSNDDDDDGIARALRN